MTALSTPRPPTAFAGRGCRVLLTLAVLVAACGAEPAAPTARLAGRITQAQGQTAVGAVVVVGDGPTRRAVVTGSSGTYAFDGVSTGQVSVHVFAPGLIYDPGHRLRPFGPGDNRYDVELTANPASLGPRFVGSPTVQVSDNRVHLAIQVQPGPDSPVGSELLAVDAADGIAVLLHRDASGRASADLAIPGSGAGARWTFLATDDACRGSSSFPTAGFTG